MISKELQEDIKLFVSKQKGRQYPCSNQIVTRVIVLQDLDRIKAFEQAYPHFVCYRRNKTEIKYIDSHSETLWKVIKCSENSRGYRFYNAIIDSTIDETIFNNIIIPYMSNYCNNVEFF